MVLLFHVIFILTSHLPPISLACLYSLVFNDLDSDWFVACSLVFSRCFPEGWFVSFIIACGQDNNNVGSRLNWWITGELIVNLGPG